MEFRKRNYAAHPIPYFRPALILTIGLVVLLTIFMLSQIKFSHYFPIKKVNVYGLKYADEQEVQDLMVPFLRRGFFHVKIDSIRERLLQMPWVSDIFVSRRWPDQVEVIMTEKQAIARWNETNLLTLSGEVFTPKLDSFPDTLPHLIGPSGKQIIMLYYFAEINRLLLPLHAKISSLTLSDYFTWTLTLENGITIRLGHKDILTRLVHFVKVYPKIIGERASDVEYIDLRYATGMAVRWKTPIKL